MISLAELRARFLALHDPEKVARAELGALFECSLAVYQGAGARRAAAEDALEAALDALEAARELEAEWLAIVHGLALRRAAAIDAGPMSPPTGNPSVVATWEWSDKRPDRKCLRVVGLRRRRLERRAGLRLVRRVIAGATTLEEYVTVAHT